MVVFGKDENDAGKSLGREDITFLKELPNVQIHYKKKLHAKFYACKDFVLLSSTNLHQFSQITI